MPVTVRFDPTSNSQQAVVIPDATPRNDGVMTKEMAALLLSLGIVAAAYVNADGTTAFVRNCTVMKLPSPGQYQVTLAPPGLTKAQGFIQGQVQAGVSGQVVVTDTTDEIKTLAVYDDASGTFFDSDFSFVGYRALFP